MLQACAVGHVSAFREDLAVGAEESAARSVALESWSASANGELPNASALVPFELEVLEDVNDGTTLHILGELSARTDWDARDVLVRLTGMVDGEPGKTDDFHLNGFEGLKNGQLAVGQPARFSLSIPSEGLTDYQVEALWGAEARVTERGRAGLRRSPIVLQDLEVETYKERCAIAPCARSFTLFGSLRNVGTELVRGVSLGVGLVWLNSGEEYDPAKHRPEKEDMIEVGALNLSPGSTQPLEIAIDKKYPTSEQGRFRPVLRIAKVY